MDTGLDALKTASKKLVHEAAEATGEFLENKITVAVAKLYDEQNCETKACNWW